MANYPTFFLLLSLLSLTLFFENASSASLTSRTSSHSEVHLTANVTSVEIGKQVALRCSLVNFTPEIGSQSKVYFTRDMEIIHEIEVKVDAQGRWSTNPGNPSNLTGLLVAPSSAEFPFYEIILTPTADDSRPYSCSLHSASDNVPDELQIVSNHLTITSTPASPAFSTNFNTSGTLLGAPWDVSCSFVGIAAPLGWEYWCTFAIGTIEAKFHSSQLPSVKKN